MFRKYYREANNDIKPDEALINSVIKSATKRRPPVYYRYVKYAAAAAAAVVVVSGAVLSMPLWQRVADDKDGVIIEETVTESSAPRTEEQTETENASEAAQPSPNTSKQSQSTSSRAASWEIKPSDATHEAEEKAETADTEVQESVSYEDAADAYADEEITVSAAEEDNAEAESYDAGLFMMSKMLPEEAADSAPAYAKEAAGGGGAAMPDAPHVSAPTGYYSTYASDTYYEFENGGEDFVTVSMFYSGGDDTAPVYAGGDGEYTAELVKDGYDVSVYGSDEAAVYEITGNLI